MEKRPNIYSQCYRKHIFFGLYICLGMTEAVNLWCLFSACCLFLKSTKSFWDSACEMKQCFLETSNDTQCASPCRSCVDSLTYLLTRESLATASPGLMDANAWLTLIHLALGTLIQPASSSWQDSGTDGTELTPGRLSWWRWTAITMPSPGQVHATIMRIRLKTRVFPSFKFIHLGPSLLDRVFGKTKKSFWVESFPSVLLARLSCTVDRLYMMLAETITVLITNNLPILFESTVGEWVLFASVMFSGMIEEGF